MSGDGRVRRSEGRYVVYRPDVQPQEDHRSTRTTTTSRTAHGSVPIRTKPTIADRTDARRRHSFETSADQIERQLNPKGGKKSKLKEDDRKNLARRQKEQKALVKTMAEEL